MVALFKSQPGFGQRRLRPGDAHDGHGNAWISCRTDRAGEKKAHRTELSGRFRACCRGMKPDQRDGGVRVSVPLPVRNVDKQQR
jgi:hypothetical protein